MEDRVIILKALEARGFSYAPYSNFLVGAAVLTGSGKIYTGCNVENSSYGAAVCAERVAIYKAVSEGERVIDAIAIAGAGREFESRLPNYTPPCGICRQVISEFADENTRILLVKGEEDYKEFSLKELFPEGFSRNCL